MLNNALTIFCLVGLIACCCTLAVVLLAPYIKVFRLLWFTIPVVALMLWAGDKPDPPAPVIVVKDIELKSFKCDHTGCEMTWACGTNITVGVDKFIILRSTRQIPARTGWSPYSEYGDSMTTNWATATPQHASDTRWMVIVRKEAN